MVYFCGSLLYRFIFFLCALPAFLFASLATPDSLMPGISPEGSSMPLSVNETSMMPGSPTMPSDSGLPLSITSPTPAMPGMLPPSLPSSPTPSAPPMPTPNLLTATQESAPQLAPVAVTTTAPEVQKSNTNTLGSNITAVPEGMKTVPALTNLTGAPLTKTLSELLTQSSSVLSIYDQATESLLQSGSPEQKITTSTRPNTSASATSADFQQNACTAGALQVTPYNKFTLPRAAQALSKTSTMSFTQQRKKCTLSDSLFDNSPLEQRFKLLLQQIKGNTNFLPLFTKFHILALSQLYQYLIGVYVSLTMTHIDSLDSYILLEQLYGLNSKALIVQYLVDLIERQLNQALLELFPNLPKTFLVHAGLSSLQTDHVSRLDLLFVNMEQVVLATFGVKSITPSQWRTILDLLINPEYQPQQNLVGAQILAPITAQLKEYLASPDINSASYPSFIKALSPNEKSALVDFLDVLTDQFASMQKIEDCKHLATILHDKTYDQFTEGQYTLLKNLLAYYSLKEPLQEAISTITSLQEKINGTEPLSTTVSPEEFKFMQSLMSLILLHMHRVGIISTYHLVQMFEPTLIDKKAELSAKDWDTFNFYKNNTFYYKIQQKQLAQSLTSCPQLLPFLSDPQVQTFLEGSASFIAATPTLTPNERSVITQLCNTIKAGGVSVENLVPEQRTLYKKIVAYMKSYVARDLLDTDCNRIFTEAFGADYIKVINDTPTPIKETLSTLNTRDRVIYYSWLQMLFEVAMYTTERCSREIAQFGCFSLYGNYIGEKFFKGISYPDYKVFLKLDRILNYNPQVTTKALDSLSDVQKKLILKLLSFLVAPHKKTPPGLFTAIAAQLVDDPGLDHVTQSVPLPPAVNLPLLADKIGSHNFNLATLTASENQFLIDLLLQYESVLSTTPSTKVPSSQTQTQGLKMVSHPLTEENERVAQTVLSVLHAEMHLSNNQNDMITSLGTLFDFFATYTATLHINPGDSISVINKEFSQFAGYARSLAHQLQGTPAGKMNPPLFIYDQKTLDHLTFLPTLAQTLQSTSHLFLPTQAIDMALLAHPVPERPIPGHDNNQVILQKDVPYNIPSLLIPNPDNPASSFSPKFFFKDKDGNPFANGSALAFPSFAAGTQGYQSVTHPKITWLAKTQVPTPSGPTDYKYYATRPLEGQEGIYMNVPLLSSDPGNKKNVLARLYEQKIIPQPDWLNDPEGVIAMTRACLGDFVTALTLDDTIFDPVINYIIRYTLVQNGAVPQDAGIPGKPQLSLDVLKQSLESYKEEAQEELLKTYVGPTSSIVKGAAT